MTHAYHGPLFLEIHNNDFNFDLFGNFRLYSSEDVVKGI